MKAMILAAGRGKRLRPLTDMIPKPLIKIDDLSLIEHLLMRLSENGFTHVVINLAHLGHKIREALGNGLRYGVNIEYSIESEEGGLETGGGIFKALPFFGQEPFLVVSGDIWTDFQFFKLRDKPLDGLAHLVVVDNPPEHSLGDFVYSQGRLVTGEGPRLTFANIGVYHPKLFLACQPGFFPLGPILHKAVSEGAVTAEYFQGEWHNVGSHEALQSLRDKLNGDKKG